MNIEGRICESPSLPLFYMLKCIHKPKVYLETGTLFGGSICYLMRDKTPCCFIGVDKFDGYYKDQDYGGSTDPVTGIEITLERALKNIDNNNPHKHQCFLVKGSSYAPETIENVTKLLGEHKIDMLFIDGDHSKEGVTNDWQYYSPMVSSGGLIIFDNYSDTTWVEVKETVDQLDFTGYKVHGLFGEHFIVQKE